MFKYTIKTPRGLIGLILSGLVVLVAVIGPFVAPYSPTSFVSTPFAPASGNTLLGADQLGRDVLSRMLAGGWQLLVMAFAAGLIGVGAGAVAGVFAAYTRGVADGLVMRLADVLLAFPSLVLALLLVSIVGANSWLVVLAVALAYAPQVARVIRSATLEVAERNFVRAAELTGMSRAQTIWRELLPNVSSPLMVEFGLRVSNGLLVIASLAFLGFGQAPPAPNWGMMINENRLGMIANPWSVLGPVLLVAMATVGFNLLTDAFAEVALGIGRRRAGAGAATETLPLGKALVEEVRA